VVGEGRLVLAVPGWRDRRLNEALRLRVAGDVPPDPGGLLGLELEFSVRSARGSRVHFGSLIHRLALDGTALDPGDPNAYRCSWGGVITSDGAEAEIATPPVRTRPGFTARLQGWAQTGEGELRRAVPRGIGLNGYSAHFSAAMPAKLNDRVCRLYAETFAVDLMMLMDRSESPGLLVRPRPGRTELCGEFIEHEPLAAAAAFVAGSTRACAAAVRRQSGRATLPPGLDVRLAPAVHRYGWYVDREAFGTDLHAAGRRVLLPRAAGGTISAQSHLELAWAAAQQALAEDAAASDLQAAEAMVTGSLPLPAEQGRPDDAPGDQRDGDIRFGPGGAAVPGAPPLCAHVRPGFTLRPVAATWDFTVFEATGPARSAYACIPRDSLPPFAAALEDGVLDEAIAAYLALPSRRRVLSASRQTARPGLYDQLGAPAGLLAPERDPQTGRQEPGGQGAKQALARPGKRNRQHQQEQAAPRKAPRFLPRAAVIAFAVAIIVAAAGVATALVSGGHRGPNGKPAGVSFQPSALIFPAVQVNARITRSFTLTNNGNSPATITGVGVSGPSRHDFSVITPALLDAARRGGQAVQPAAQHPPCQGHVPHAQTCTITVAFAPLTPGAHTADLRIYLASSPQPQDLALRGTGTITPPPASSSVSITSVSPAHGTAQGGTSVTITGTGFTAPPAVTGVSFGGAAAQFTIDSGTQMTATSPHGSGTVHITVTTPAGTSAATAADQYRYTQSATTMTTMGLSSSANPSAPRQPVTFTAKVRPASGTGTPTGTVTFSDGGSQIGTATLKGGTATIGTASPLALGSHPITASYGGDRNFAASTGSLTQTVSPAATTTAVKSSANPLVVGHGVLYTATVSPVPNGGTVTFSDGGKQICSVQQVDTSTGTATCPQGYKITGTHSITAVYSGDTAYLTSTGLLTETVIQVATTTAVISSVNPSVVGQSVIYTATVSPAPNGGTVTFSDGGTQIIGCVNLPVDTSTGTATCPQGYKLTGTHSITAVYSGDFEYQTSTGGPLTQVVK
jgi:Bacterial Ig-like domain (group 3)/IPT/TIG domain